MPGEDMIELRNVRNLPSSLVIDKKNKNKWIEKSQKHEHPEEFTVAIFSYCGEKVQISVFNCAEIHRKKVWRGKSEIYASSLCSQFTTGSMKNPVKLLNERLYHILLPHKYRV